MFLPLTTQQQAFLDTITTEFHTLKLAIIQAVKADNDPTNDLDDARAKRLSLNLALNRFEIQVLNIPAGALRILKDPNQNPGQSGLGFHFRRALEDRGEVDLRDTPTLTI